MADYHFEDKGIQLLQMARRTEMPVENLLARKAVGYEDISAVFREPKNLWLQENAAGLSADRTIQPKPTKAKL
ncbi:MAG: hypothetical protein KBI01_04565 [Oscillospiraceae bacterium]|nr:hypothetical protein [Oscillospiraceae bacterium]